MYSNQWLSTQKITHWPHPFLICHRTPGPKATLMPVPTSVTNLINTTLTASPALQYWSYLFQWMYGGRAHAVQVSCKVWSFHHWTWSITWPCFIWHQRRQKGARLFIGTAWALCGALQWMADSSTVLASMNKAAMSGSWWRCRALRCTGLGSLSRGSDVRGKTVVSCSTVTWHTRIGNKPRWRSTNIQLRFKLAAGRWLLMWWCNVRYDSRMSANTQW